jgi:transposase-like protein
VETKRSRKKHSPAFKSKVAVEAIRMVNTVPDIAKRYEVHPSQVYTWKKRALEGLADLFTDGAGNRGREGQDKLIADLYEQIGRLQVELQWLKKKSGFTD